MADGLLHVQPATYPLHLSDEESLMTETRRLARRVGVALVIAALPAALGACSKTKSGSSSSTGSSGGSIKIGLVTKTESNPYFISMRDAATKEATAKGATLIAKAGTLDGDNASQVTAVENLVASGVKAILITPNDSKAIVPTLQAAQAKGIFVAALDTQTDGNQGVDATWATDNTKAGVLEGQYVKAALAGKTPILAMLDLQPGVSVGDQRHNGFLQGLGIPNSSPDIAGKEDTSGDQAKGQTAMENLLQKNGNINSVYTINEPAAIGAYTALKNAGKAANVVLASIDGGCTGVAAVKAGQIAATVMQFPSKMAIAGVDAAVDFAKSGTKPTVPASGYIDTGVQLITDKPLGLDAKDTTWGAQNCWGKAS
jgi:fructose transport system substrate-binding protein